MDKLPEALVLDILGRLNDSADIARCRLAWKIIDTVSPDLLSITLQCSLARYLESASTVSNSSSFSQFISSFKTLFLSFVSKLKVVESVCIGTEKSLQELNLYIAPKEVAGDRFLTDNAFVKEWLPKVSGALKSLSISDFCVESCWRRSKLLRLVAAYCHNLLKLEVKNAWLFVRYVNPMPTLTSLTLEFVRLEDKNLTELNKCFPNLQVLNLIGIRELKRPKIHFLYLKTCHFAVRDLLSSLSLITPSLVTLELEFLSTNALYIDAPMLSHFHFCYDRIDSFGGKSFENLKTFWCECIQIASIFSKFSYPFTARVENLILDSPNLHRDAAGLRYSRYTLGEVLDFYPSVTSLCIKASAWSHFPQSYNPEYRGRWDHLKLLKTFCGYLSLSDPLSDFKSVGCVLYQFVGLVDVSLLIPRDLVDANVSRSLISECMACWPNVNWRWGTWEEGTEDSWITQII